jgi:hypothetical protein
MANKIYIFTNRFLTHAHRDTCFMEEWKGSVFESQENQNRYKKEESAQLQLRVNTVNQIYK